MKLSIVSSDSLHVLLLSSCGCQPCVTKLSFLRHAALYCLLCHLRTSVLLEITTTFKWTFTATAVDTQTSLVGISSLIHFLSLEVFPLLPFIAAGIIIRRWIIDVNRFFRLHTLSPLRILLTNHRSHTCRSLWSSHHVCWIMLKWKNLTDTSFGIEARELFAELLYPLLI